MELSPQVLPHEPAVTALAGLSEGLIKL